MSEERESSEVMDRPWSHPLDRAAGLVALGWTYADAARWLEGEGCFTSTGRPYGGGTLARTLRNPAVAGLTYDSTGRLVPSGGQARVSRERFEALLLARPATQRPAATPRNPLLDRGVATCGLCAAPLQTRHQKDHPEGFLYRCKGPKTCGRVHVLRAPFEHHVTQLTDAELRTPGSASRLRAAAQSMTVRKISLETSLLELAQKGADLASRYSFGLLSPQKYRDEQLAAQVADADLRRAIDLAYEVCVVPEEFWGDAPGCWDEVPAKYRRAVLILLFSEVALLPAVSGRGRDPASRVRVVRRAA